jgi:hypothetical protein
MNKRLYPISEAVFNEAVLPVIEGNYIGKGRPPKVQKKTLCWRLMQRYEAMKKGKGSGRAIIATARKIAVIIWNMLTGDVEFDQAKMTDARLAKKSERMSRSAGMAKEARIEAKPEITYGEKKGEAVEKKIQGTGVASRKRKKAG